MKKRIIFYFIIFIMIFISGVVAGIIFSGFHVSKALK